MDINENSYYSSSLGSAKLKEEEDELKVDRALEFSLICSSLPMKRKLLEIKVKMLDEVKTIEITNYDNIYAKAFQFCYDNRLGLQFVIPITCQIFKALEYINSVIFSEVDGDKMDNIREGNTN
jgi:hypothetical protein